MILNAKISYLKLLGARGQRSTNVYFSIAPYDLVVQIKSSLSVFRWALLVLLCILTNMDVKAEY